MKRSIILVGALALGACEMAPSAPVALGDDMYTMREGVRTHLMAIEDANKFCAGQNKRFKYIRDDGPNYFKFACLNEGEHIEMRAPSQRLELQVR